MHLSASDTEPCWLVCMLACITSLLAHPFRCSQGLWLNTLRGPAPTLTWLVTEPSSLGRCCTQHARWGQRLWLQVCTFKCYKCGVQLVSACVLMVQGAEFKVQVLFMLAAFLRCTNNTMQPLLLLKTALQLNIFTSCCYHAFSSCTINHASLTQAIMRTLLLMAVTAAVWC